jgi:hypothetical protein
MKSKSLAVVQVLVAAGGVFYTLTGAALLFAPLWFYTYIGNYPPFNRHYAGDLGSFLLPLGFALLIAARKPLHHRLLVAYTAAGSLLHSLNHLYDDLAGPTPDPLETTLLFLFSLLWLWACWARPGESAQLPRMAQEEIS